MAAVLPAIGEPAPDYMALLDRVLAYLEAGMPLRAEPFPQPLRVSRSHVRPDSE